jgi:hypothetical protein
MAYTQAMGRVCGRVDYWQCHNEPSNTGMLWAGTASDYVDQLAGAGKRRQRPRSGIGYADPFDPIGPVFHKWERSLARISTTW